MRGWNQLAMLSQTDAAATRRTESCSLAMVRRVAAMLDQDPDGFAESQLLPRGWHFFMLGGDTRRSQLRSDGFPGLGVPMPDIGLPRLLLAGRSVSFSGDIAIGEVVERRSWIDDITEKTGASGRWALVKVSHSLRPLTRTEAAVLETQTYALLPPAPATARPATSTPDVSPDTHQKRTITPDETLLFQYSALGFNSHKIHIDRDHAQRVEGLPDLVVNGGLITLLATEFLRNDLRITPAGIRARHLAPLYCNRPMTIGANSSASGWHLRIANDGGILAAELEVDVA
jgi:3-methylfumaryl-CoA hydratase